MTIEIVAGSPRTDSVTYRVALFLQKMLRDRIDHTINILDVRDWPLPMLQEVFSSVERTPEPFKPLARRMFGADAFILVSPEYNGSYTPALKNLFDHFPKQSRKPFGIVTASPGALGGMRATQQMQLLIHALFGIGLPQMLVIPGVDKKFSPDGDLLDPNFQRNADQFLNEFTWLAERLVPEMHPVG